MTRRRKYCTPRVSGLRTLPGGNCHSLRTVTLPARAGLSPAPRAAGMGGGFPCHGHATQGTGNLSKLNRARGLLWLLRLLVCDRRVLYGRRKVILYLRMLRLTNLENRWRRHCAAMVVLVAVSLLVVSVATRYCSSQSSSSYAVRTFHKHSSPEPGRQHLTKSAADWIPPVVATAVFEAPTSYPRIAPAGPPIPSILLELSLYNRPPPSC